MGGLTGVVENAVIDVDKLEDGAGVIEVITTVVGTVITAVEVVRAIDAKVADGGDNNGGGGPTLGLC